MIDSLAIAGLASGIVAVIVAAITHLKFSKCFGFELTTYSPTEMIPQPNIVITTPPSTPELKHSNETNI